MAETDELLGRSDEVLRFQIAGRRKSDSEVYYDPKTYTKDELMYCLWTLTWERYKTIEIVVKTK